MKKKIVPLVGSLIDLYYYLFDMTGDGGIFPG